MSKQHENERNQFWTDITLSGPVVNHDGEVVEHSLQTAVRISIIRPQDTTGQWNATAKLVDDTFSEIPPVTVKFDPGSISNVEAANSALKQLAVILVSITPDFKIDADEIL
jgi:hypothetical protein